MPILETLGGLHEKQIAGKEKREIKWICGKEREEQSPSSGSQPVHASRHYQQKLGEVIKCQGLICMEWL